MNMSMPAHKFSTFVIASALTFAILLMAPAALPVSADLPASDIPLPLTVTAQAAGTTGLSARIAAVQAAASSQPSASGGTSATESAQAAGTTGLSARIAAVQAEIRKNSKANSHTGVSSRRISEFLEEARSKAAKYKKYVGRKSKKTRIVLCGSSTINKWKSAKGAFPGYEVINMGVGGSVVSEWQTYYKKFVTKYKPDVILFYCGTNDLSRGIPGTRVAENTISLLNAMKAKCPKTVIFYLGMIPTPRRRASHTIGELNTANQLMKEYCDSTDGVEYLDVGQYMSTPDGIPLSKNMFRDSIHPSRRAYKTIFRQHVAKPIIKYMKNKKQK